MDDDNAGRTRLRAELERRRRDDERLRSGSRAAAASPVPWPEAGRPGLDVWDDLPGFAFLLADDHSIRGASRRFGERFGDWSGRNCYEVLRHRSEPCVVCPTWRVFETGDPQRWDWTDHDGRSYEVFDYPFGEEDGRPLVLEVGLDVTDRKRLEASLRESEDKYHLALETMGEGVVVLQDARIKFANARAGRMAGYPVDELRTGSIARLIHPDDREPILQRHIERIAGRELPEVYECRLVRKDQTVWWAQVRGARLYWDGRPATLNFITDITALKTAQQTLEATRQEKDAVAREMHHRFQSQIQVISSLLSPQTSPGRDPDGVRAVTKAQSRLATLGLIQDILHRSGSLTHVDLHAFARSLTDELGWRFGAPAAGIDLEVNGPPVYVDPGRATCCGLIVHELVGNALKNAFPQGGPGLISVGASLESDGAVQLTVTDNGVGLPPGWDASPPSSLGQALVRRLVEDRLGGRLVVASESGARFTITFRP
ncbi:MAG: PAS domain S-box protein [Proteobacteria bacterium]|nr:PAS domain S-box protein [Pseudomonadota bacterium]MBU1741786.1 PAS domain S-box protein [Pseudomonadota bacterium]